MSENAHRFASINRMYRLMDLRRRHRLTQNEVARRMGVRQPRVSQLEAGDLSRVGIGSLNAYVAALGGRLHVVADFGDELLHLHLEGGRLRIVPEPPELREPVAPPGDPSPPAPLRETATA